MIYLVGSGPGDPGLFTVKGVKCMEMADAVVYDRLAPKSLLTYAKDDAEFIYVGKKPGNPSMSQEDINACLVELGHAGKTVVRLKGGDPYIFGRGGEEALALLEADLPFEVVPGVTSGVAAPSYAGIPVTHRKVSTSVAFVTGHEDPTKGSQDVDWGGLASGADTLVLYMGIGRLREISDELIAAGKNPATPTACVRWGTLPEQQTVTGTLGGIAERVAEENLKPPAITIIGDVVSLRGSGLDWYEKRPLFGRRIVVTRARAQAGELSSELENLGAEVMEFPTIEIKPPGDLAPLDQAIRELEGYDWLIFTSVNGVEAFMDRLEQHELDVRSIPKGAKIAAVGPSTRDRIKAAGLRVDVTPSEYRAEALLDEMLVDEISGQRILLPQAKVAREVLPERLREAGAEVFVPTAYETVPSDAGRDSLVARFRAGEVDCVTFTASSTVENFVRAFGEEETAKLLEDTRVACIGPITAATSRKYGIKVDAEADEYTIPGLVETVRGLFTEQN